MEAAMTLHFFDHLLARGRMLQGLGLGREAMRLFKKMASCRDLPQAVAEETQKRLGELRLESRQYAKARRHFAAALAYQPYYAGYHHLLATATRQDDDAEPRRALEHLRQAVELDPGNAGFWADLGLLALEQGDMDEGLAALKKASELAPDDVNILAKVVPGLVDAGQAEEARSLLLAARFRHRRQPRVEKMWNDFQFQMLHERQHARYGT